MEIRHGLAGLRSLAPGAVLSVGNYDGIHLGHRKLLELLNAARAIGNGRVAVVTFEPHPLTVLRPHLAPPRLTPPAIKQALLEQAGVDDYVSKPFEPRELLLRLRNILRRGQAPSPSRDEIRMGGCVFSLARGELKRDEETIKLTERERDLLRLFAQRIGVAVPRHELSNDDNTGSERAIDVQINRLRRKIESDPSNPVYLQTVRGKGYILYID